ncbi:MAG: GspE/PulE family protein [Holosporales bacterium]|jgi:type II secretory ATPase GspE/PulE/Tfp pilus assembly ATPase PilB-like protein|nr:GspE/PulE family protein [Holosporales bacterium]
MLASTVTSFQKILLERGLVSLNQVQIAREEMQETLERIDEIFVKLGFVSAETAADVLFEITGFKQVNLDAWINFYIVNGVNFCNIDGEALSSGLVTVFHCDAQAIKIAMYDPEDLPLKDVVLRVISEKFQNQPRLQFFYASKTGIVNFRKMYDSLKNSRNMKEPGETTLYTKFSEPEGLAIPRIKEESSVMSPLKELPPIKEQAGRHEISAMLEAINENPHNIADFLDFILQQAIANRASDIHFQPERFLVKVRYRVDGLLQQACSLHKNVWQNFLVRLKVLANLDISESRRPQSGHFEKEIGGHTTTAGKYSLDHASPPAAERDCLPSNCLYDFRVSTHPIVFGESVVIRILYKNREVLSLDELGFSQQIVDALNVAIHAPYGLILLCGPTGSGKTTTLYTLCSLLDAETLNIMTLEDPVESQLKNVRQTEIRASGVLSFAAGIRSVLRQDPDVIFVGEIRDEDTARIALRASMTGHLVLSTLHVNDVLHIPNRLYDLGLSPTLLAGQLLLLMSQRLVRRVCTVCGGGSCNQDAPKDGNNPPTFGDAIHEKNAGICRSCNDIGFRGRLAIAEAVVIDAELDLLIAEQASLAVLREAMLRKNFRSMYEDGLAKADIGLTTKQEVARVIANHN